MNIDDINNELDILSREYSTPPQQLLPQQSNNISTNDEAEQTKKRELDEQMQRNKMHNNYVFNSFINPQFDNNGFKKVQDGRMLALPSRSGEELYNLSDNMLNPELVNNVGVNANIRVPSMMHSQFENSYEFTPTHTPIQTTTYNSMTQQNNNLQMQRNLQIRNIYDNSDNNLDNNTNLQLTDREKKWLMINDLMINDRRKIQELQAKLDSVKFKLNPEQIRQAEQHIKSQIKNYNQEQFTKQQIEELIQKKKLIDRQNIQLQQQQSIYPQQPQFLQHNKQQLSNLNMLDVQFGNNSGNGQIKKDIRQSMNSQIGSFIFDNVNNINPPMIPRSIDPFGIDNKVVIQEKSKNLYKNETNERLSMLNPIGRAMSFPVHYDSSRPTNYL